MAEDVRKNRVLEDAVHPDDWMSKEYLLHAFEEDQRSCLDAGMNAHITKPIEPKIMY